MFPLDVGQSDRSYWFTHVTCRSTDRGCCFRGLVQWKIIRCYLHDDQKPPLTMEKPPEPPGLTHPHFVTWHLTLPSCVCVYHVESSCVAPPICCWASRTADRLVARPHASTPASWLPPIDLFQETLTAGRKREAEKKFFLPELLHFFSKLQ